MHVVVDECWLRFVVAEWVHVAATRLVRVLTGACVRSWVRRAHAEGLLRLLEQISVLAAQHQAIEDLHLLGKEDASEDDQDADKEDPQVASQFAFKHRLWL